MCYTQVAIRHPVRIPKTKREKISTEAALHEIGMSEATADAYGPERPSIAGQRSANAILSPSVFSIGQHPQSIVPSKQ